MMDLLYYWGPTFAIAAAVLVSVQVGISKQTKLLNARNENSAQQTAELRKINQSLERVATAIEASRKKTL